MSSFKCEVVPVIIEPHTDPEVNALELAGVGEYRCVVRKGQFKTGDRVVYIPEASILPEPLIAELGLTGRLAGSDHNRVKAIRLRGVVSQGLVLPARSEWEIGQDVSSELGITKWEPPIPVALAGDVGSCGLKIVFDLENIKRHGEIMQDGEEVWITEKLHGTCQITGIVDEKYQHPEMFNGNGFICSKGLSAQGLFFKDNERNSNNVYIKTARKYELLEKLAEIKKNKFPNSGNVFIFGETFGKGVQDLTYGTTQPEFRAFAMKVDDQWIRSSEFFELCQSYGIPTVTVLYHGPYSREILQKHTDGETSVGGGHIREGAVVVPESGRRDPLIGRVALKSVSDAYLLRKGPVTEFT